MYSESGDGEKKSKIAKKSESSQQLDLVEVGYIVERCSSVTKKSNFSAATLSISRGICSILILAIM